MSTVNSSNGKSLWVVAVHTERSKFSPRVYCVVSRDPCGEHCALRPLRTMNLHLAAIAYGLFWCGWLKGWTVYFDLHMAWLIGWPYVHALLCPNTVVMGTEEMETKQVFFSVMERRGNLPSLSMLVLTSSLLFALNVPELKSQKRDAPQGYVKVLLLLKDLFSRFCGI